MTRDSRRRFIFSRTEKMNRLQFAAQKKKWHEKDIEIDAWVRIVLIYLGY